MKAKLQDPMFLTKLSSAGTLLLLALWIPVNIERLDNFSLFASTIHQQHLPEAYRNILTGFIPLTEISTAIALCFSPSRKTGLQLSTGLLLIYSSYIAIVLAGFTGPVPCSCAGPLPLNSWKEQLAATLLLALISAGTLYLYTHRHPLPGRQWMKG